MDDLTPCRRLPDGSYVLGEVPAGTKIAKYRDGLICAHPNEVPYYLEWSWDDDHGIVIRKTPIKLGNRLSLEPPEIQLPGYLSVGTAHD